MAGFFLLVVEIYNVFNDVESNGIVSYCPFSSASSDRIYNVLRFQQKNWFFQKFATSLLLTIK